MNNQERGVIAWFVDNPVAANLLMWFIIISGILSIAQIRKEVVPNKQKDTISISVAYPGASPLEVEEGITLKIEEALKNISGIKKIHANSSYGASHTNVDVDDDFNADKLTSQIKIAIDSIKSFPNYAEKPIIAQSLYSGLAIQLQLHGDNLTERSAKLLAHEIKEDLLAQTDIKKVAVWGDKPFEIGIAVDEQKLRKYQLTIDDVARKIRYESINLPSGGIDSSRGLIILRVDGQSYRQADFEKLVLLTQENGVVIRLGDVAKINDGFVKYNAKGYFDGDYSVGIAVFAVGNQDINEIAKQAKAFIEPKKNTLPEGVSLTAWGDITYYLSASQSMMLDNMLWGALLVALILALFLNIRIVFWIIAGLPVCFMGTLFLMPMPFADVSINILSIFGFILVLGIIVDDAIIIGESVDTEINNNGYSRDAVVRGVKKVFLPAFFGVLTTVAAFFPMIMIEGPWKAAPHAIGFIVIFCLLFSLLESKLILPAHLAAAHHGLFSKFRFTWHDNFQKRNNLRLSRWVTKVYQPLLKVSLKNRYITVALFIAVLLLTLGLIGSNLVKYVLLPSDGSDFLKVTLNMAKGTKDSSVKSNVQKITDGIYQVERDYQKEYKTESKLIQHLFYFKSNASNAEFTLELTKQSEREIDSFEIIKKWRKVVGEIPEANLLSFSAVMESDTSSHQLYYMLTSRNQNQLRAAANALADHLKITSGISNIQSSAKGVQESYILRLKPRAVALGLTHVDISKQVHDAFFGAEAQRIQRDNNEIKVMVRLPSHKRQTLSDLYEMDVKVSGNRFIPLSELVYLQESNLQSKLTRINYQSAAFVKARLDKNILSPKKVHQNITDVFIPELLKQYPSVQYNPKGENADEKDLEYDLAMYFILAFFAVFALLAIPLKSYFQPMIIMSVVPFGIVGAVFGHWVMGFPVSMMSLFGVIALTGVVVNDSLIMVDFINRAKARGLSSLESTIESGRLRFRAIFLTTATTFAGVAPMLMENDMRAENMVPMAISLGFGILFATAITLILVPCSYMILDDIKNLFKGDEATALPNG